MGLWAVWMGRGLSPGLFVSRAAQQAGCWAAEIFLPSPACVSSRSFSSSSLFSVDPVRGLRVCGAWPFWRRQKCRRFRRAAWWEEEKNRWRGLVWWAPDGEALALVGGGDLDTNPRGVRHSSAQDCSQRFDDVRLSSPVPRIHPQDTHSQPSPQPPFSPSASGQATPDGPFNFDNLDPNAAKQMAALQATSLAKAGNRYAPGGVTSASYFGGLSNHQLSRLDASSTTELNNFSPSLQQGPQAQAVPTNVNPPTLRVYAAY